jgi:hypothetical protein
VDQVFGCVFWPGCAQIRLVQGSFQLPLGDAPVVTGLQADLAYETLDFCVLQGQLFAAIDDVVYVCCATLQGSGQYTSAFFFVLFFHAVAKCGVHDWRATLFNMLWWRRTSVLIDFNKS